MGTVDVTGGIITGGLGRPACEQIITRAFHLFCDDITPTPSVPGGGGGGYYPKPAHNVYHDGQIKDFYKEIDVKYKPVEDDRAYEKAKKYHIRIGVKIYGQEYSREFMLGRVRRNTIISAVNFINNSRDRISVIVKNISATTKRWAFKVKNLIYRN